MTLKWLEETRIWLACGRKWWNWLILENQRHFLTMSIWDVLNANAHRTKLLLRCTGKCSNLFAGATEKLPGWEKPHAKTVAWSYDTEGHAKKCVERCCELANKKTEQLHKVSTPYLDDHHFKKEELESVGELPKVCSQIFVKMLVFVMTW